TRSSTRPGPGRAPRRWTTNSPSPWSRSGSTGWARSRGGAPPSGGAGRARFDRLIALQEAIALERMREQVGSSAEVLIEGLGRKGGARGRTRGNRVVHVGGEHAPGTFLDVRIVGGPPPPPPRGGVGGRGGAAGGGGRAPGEGSGEEPPLLALVGPTAAGKTEAGIAVAELLGAEIVSVDSMLVYRGMDIGTAKPTAAQRARVPHHLLDAAEPSETFSVARYQELAREAIAGIRGRGRRVLLVGGSALYERAVVDDLGFPGTDAGTRRRLEAEAAVVGAAGLHERLAASDPAGAARIEPGNVRRTVRALEVARLTGQPFSSFAGGWETYEAHRVRAAGISMLGPVLRTRIEARVAEMLERGWLDEVRGL